MTVTVTIDDAIFAEAAAAVRKDDPKEVIQIALAALAPRRAAQLRLAALGGAMPEAEMPPRRRQGDYGS